MQRGSSGEGCPGRLTCHPAALNYCSGSLPMRVKMPHEISALYPNGPRRFQRDTVMEQMTRAKLANAKAAA